MKKLEIKIKEQIFINQNQEAVWNYTQDYSRRLEWDKSLSFVEVIQQHPILLVKVKAKHNFEAIYKYKVVKKPHFTTLIFEDIKSSFIIEGGGSWRYEDVNGGTLWIQQGSLVFRKTIWTIILKIFITMILRYSVKKGMRSVKNNLELRMT